MTIELIIILVSLLLLVTVYFSRIKSKEEGTLLFSENFLQKADEKIFDFIKFVFKMYSLLAQNLFSFVTKIPYKIVHLVHKFAHSIAAKSTVWVEKITHKNIK